eukprot:10632305-Ditylum_brightwellii.AAC.1
MTFQSIGKGYVDVLMPGYMLRALKQFQHVAPKHPQHAPHQWNKLAYGQKIQYAKAPDISIRLDAKGQRLIQSIVGTFLYYARAIDGIALPALNNIGTQQSKPTKNTIKDTT